MHRHPPDCAACDELGEKLLRACLLAWDDQQLVEAGLMRPEESPRLSRVVELMRVIDVHRSADRMYGEGDRRTG